MSTGDKPGAGRAGEVPAAGCATWECFRDEAYYGMSCVRRIGEREFGRGFHVSTLEEAEELTCILNDLERDKRRLGWLDKRLDYFGRISLRIEGKPERCIVAEESPDECGNYHNGDEIGSSEGKLLRAAIDAGMSHNKKLSGALKKGESRA